MVPRVLAAHRGKGRLRHIDRLGHHADHFQRRRVCHQPVSGDGAPRGFQPIDPAERSGLPDRPSRIAAQAEGHDTGRHRGRRSAAGPPGTRRRIPWIPGLHEGGVLRGGAHPELVEIGLAGHHRSRLLELLDRGRGIRGNEIAKETGAAGKAEAAHRDIVFYGKRDARQGRVLRRGRRRRSESAPQERGRAAESSRSPPAFLGERLPSFPGFFGRRCAAPVHSFSARQRSRDGYSTFGMTT